MASDTTTVLKNRDCPGECDGKCKFKLEVHVEYGTAGGVKIIESARVTMHYSPVRSDPVPTEVCTRWCEADIDRELGEGDYMTFVALDGTRFKFTKDSFPPGDYWPPKWDKLPAGAQDTVEIAQDAPDGWKGASYKTKAGVKIRDLEVDFTLRNTCKCMHVTEGEPPLKQEAISEGEISISGRWPMGS